MADDLHDVAKYLNEMRICFIMLTVTVYVVLAVWLVLFCVRRNRRQVSGGQRRPNRSHWDYQVRKLRLLEIKPGFPQMVLYNRVGSAFSK